MHRGRVAAKKSSNEASLDAENRGERRGKVKEAGVLRYPTQSFTGDQTYGGDSASNSCGLAAVQRGEKREK
jgi:hypothetical protein